MVEYLPKVEPTFALILHHIHNTMGDTSNYEIGKVDYCAQSPTLQKTSCTK